MARAARQLSDDDRILWARVAKSTRPLPGRMVADIEAPEMAPEPPAHPAAEQSCKLPLTINGKTVPAPPPHPQHAIDRTTKRKIAKGRMTIDARIDLHGMAQAEAHMLLQSFLHRAQAEGCRLVLVITGKGASFGSDGVLRRAVPEWLRTPPFRMLVSGFEEAARGHGGEGALYLRVRQRNTRP